MLISVVVPAYNEVDTLPLILKKIDEVPHDKEIIIVDDGSKDGTREWICSEYGIVNQASVVQEGKQAGRQSAGLHSITVGAIKKARRSSGKTG